MITTCVAMALLAGGMPGPYSQKHDATTTVHVRIDQDAGLPPAQLSEALNEMQRIWRAAGVTITAGRYGEPSAPGGATVSLRLLGTAARKSNGGTVLAWVSLTESGQPAPILFVSLEGIRELLDPVEFRGHPLRKRPQSIRDRLLAMAIGRAAAHELGHFLRPERQHTTHGLMRARYRTSDLIGDSLVPFQVPADERVAVRREVTRLAHLQTAGQ
jgi:hypothetical protein